MSKWRQRIVATIMNTIARGAEVAVEKVGIVGGGLMGSGIAEVSAKAGIDVTRRIWSPSLPISPAMYILTAGQPGELGQVIYANSITLTPGTVTVRLDGGDIMVHAITREAGDDLASGEMDRRVTRLEASGIKMVESAK